ncbi:MAG: AraC family transcriptional regulator [Alcaligenes sp.]
MSTRFADQAREHLSGILAPHRLELKTRQAVCFTHNRLLLQSLSLHFIEYGVSAGIVSQETQELSDHYLFKIPLTGVAQYRQASTCLEIRPGMLFIVHPGEAFSSAMSADYTHLTLQLDAASIDLEDDGPGLGMGYRRACFETARINAEGHARALSGILQAVCEDTVSGDSLLGLPAFRQTIEKIVINAVRALPRCQMEHVSSVVTTPAPFFVKRAEEYMHAHLTASIRVDDLVQAVGVSRRTLHAGFRNFRQTTPGAHLKRMKLDAARSALLNARDTGENVTEVATRFGFFHLGKFARDFRSQFGQSPSEMLKPR